MADKIGTKFTIYLRNEALAYVDERAKEKGVTRSRYIEMKVVPKELQRKDNRRGRYERKADQKSKAGNKAGSDWKFRGVCGNDRRKPLEAPAENNFQDFIQDVIGGKK